MIKAIIFDLNGVFIKSPKLSDRFEKDFGVSTLEFLPALQDIMAKVRQPNSGDAFPLWQPYLEKWDIDMNKKEFFKYWFEAEEEVLELIDFGRSLKERNLKLFILSNNFSERSKYYADNFPFLSELFEKVYYSWQTGFIKPDPKAFELILKENNLLSGECLFFDDSEKNIESAKSIGIIATFYENNRTMINDIEEAIT